MANIDRWQCTNGGNTSEIFHRRFQEVGNEKFMEMKKIYSKDRGILFLNYVPGVQTNRERSV